MASRDKTWQIKWAIILMVRFQCLVGEEHHRSPQNNSILLLPDFIFCYGWLFCSEDWTRNSELGELRTHTTLAWHISCFLQYLAGVAVVCWWERVIWIPIDGLNRNGDARRYICKFALLPCSIFWPYLYICNSWLFSMVHRCYSPIGCSLCHFEFLATPSALITNASSLFIIVPISMNCCALSLPFGWVLFRLLVPPDQLYQLCVIPYICIPCAHISHT